MGHVINARFDFVRLTMNILTIQETLNALCVLAKQREKCVPTSQIGNASTQKDVEKVDVTSRTNIERKER